MRFSAPVTPLIWAHCLVRLGGSTLLQEKSKSRGASGESASRDGLHVCGRVNRPALHLCLRQVGYYPSPRLRGSFSIPFALLPVMCRIQVGTLARRPEQVGDGAAYTFPLIAGSPCIVCETKTMRRACRGSQSCRGPSQSVLNGLHQCVIAITRSSQGPRQDELCFMALRQIFFPFFSPMIWMRVFFLWVTWCARATVCAFELCHNHRSPFTFPEGDIFCLSQNEVADSETTCT